MPETLLFFFPASLHPPGNREFLVLLAPLGIDGLSFLEHACHLFVFRRASLLIPNFRGALHMCPNLQWSHRKLSSNAFVGCDAEV